MSEKTLSEKVSEIYDVIVGEKPASAKLVQAAQKVVDARYDSSKEWDDLKDAICGLWDALESEK